VVVVVCGGAAITFDELQSYVDHPQR